MTLKNKLKEIIESHSILTQSDTVMLDSIDSLVTDLYIMMREDIKEPIEDRIYYLFNDEE